jgi:hypothetical protein
MMRRLSRFAGLIGLGVFLACSAPLSPSARAGVITVIGYGGNVVLVNGDDNHDPDGADTPLIRASMSAPNNSHSVSLSLSRSGSDNIVSVTGTATLTALDTIDAAGNHATADVTLTGATTTTGSLINHQAQVLALSETS